MRFNFFLLFTLVPVFLFSQVNFSGKVIDEETGARLVGAQIKELNMENSCVSDDEGNFEIQSITENPVFLVSHNEYDNHLIPVSIDLKLTVGMGNGGIAQYGVVPKLTVGLGLSVDLLNKVFGGAAEFTIPYAFQKRLNIMGSAKWRFLPQDEYVSIDLRRYGIVKMDKALLGLRAGYKSIQKKEGGFQTRQLSIAPELGFDYFCLALGYARRENFEAVGTQQANGLNLEFGAAVLGFRIQAQTIYWFDDWQYAVHVRKRIFRTKFHLSLGHEAYYGFEAVDCSIVYSQFF